MLLAGTGARRAVCAAVRQLCPPACRDTITWSLTSTLKQTLVARLGFELLLRARLFKNGLLKSSFPCRRVLEATVLSRLFFGAGTWGVLVQGVWASRVKFYRRAVRVAGLARKTGTQDWHA